MRRNIDANLTLFWKSCYSYQDVPTANLCWDTVPGSRLPQPQPCAWEHKAATDHGFQAGSKKRVKKRLNNLCWCDILTRVKRNGRKYSITHTFFFFFQGKRKQEVHSSFGLWTSWLLNTDSATGCSHYKLSKFWNLWKTTVALSVRSHLV